MRFRTPSIRSPRRPPPKTPLQVSKDKLTVAYTGAGAHTNDVGAIQANAPLPRRVPMSYFEVAIVASGERGLIGVGFTDAGAKLGRQPGWEPGTYGYHGDDGKKYHARGSGEAYGPRFGAGDVVGAGIDWERGVIFFTKGGRHLGTAFTGPLPPGPLFPTVGLHSRGERVTVNFGATPFRFDLDAATVDARAFARAVGVATAASSASTTAAALVRDYLLHAGHARTLAALEEAAGGAAPPAGADDPRRATLAARAAARAALATGDVDAAEAVAGAARSGATALADATVRAFLDVQRFVESVRRGDAAAAVARAPGGLTAALSAGGPAADMARDAAALAAYEDPATCPVGGLLGEGQRTAAADALNAALLPATSPSTSSHPSAPASSLERVLRQLVTAADEAHAAGGGRGEPFRLVDHLPPLA